MKIKSEDFIRIIKWFEIAQDSLGDRDLKLYDKIVSHLEYEGIDYDSFDLDKEEDVEEVEYNYEEDFDE